MANRKLSTSYNGIVKTVENVRLIRRAYRPASCPQMLIPETLLLVDVGLRDGETVQDVINYHWGNRAVIAP